MKNPIELMDEIERENVPRLRPGMLALHQDWQQLRAAIEAQAGKLARYEQWVNDLQSGMYINCVYCGHRYGPDSDVPTSMADALKEHIEECPEHPMSALKEELAQAKVRIARIEEAVWAFKDGEGPAEFQRSWHHLMAVALNESPAQSLASVKAEALREYANRKRQEAERCDGVESMSQRTRLECEAASADREAERIEREAKEEL